MGQLPLGERRRPQESSVARLAREVLAHVFDPVLVHCAGVPRERNGQLAGPQPHAVRVEQPDYFPYPRGLLAPCTLLSAGRALSAALC